MGENETDKLEDTQDKTVEDQSNGSKNNDDADTGKDGGTGTDDKNSKVEDDKDSDNTEKDNDDDKKSQKSTSKADDSEPSVRKRSDFIKERIERRQQKQAEKSDNPDKDNEDEDVDLDDTDKKTIGKVVKEYLQPLVEKDMKAQDEQEISQFLKDNPDFKPFEAKARKWMDHPSRKDVPIDEIFYGVAGKDLLKIGAKRAQIANDEAKATATGGSQDLGGSKSVSEMSKAEFEAKQIEIRQKLADRD
mgnify:CR=1 FL=1|jgi:hypothetical protein